VRRPFGRHGETAFAWCGQGHLRISSLESEAQTRALNLSADTRSTVSIIWLILTRKRRERHSVCCIPRLHRGGAEAAQPTHHRRPRSDRCPQPSIAGSTACLIRVDRTAGATQFIVRADD
jgi:hypothetical protein